MMLPMLMMAHGAGAVPDADFPSLNPWGTGNGTDVAWAAIGFWPDGTYEAECGSFVDSGATSGTWMLAGANTDFEIYCTVLGGDPLGASSPTGTWLSMAEARYWQLDAEYTSRFTTVGISIRNKHTLATLVSRECALIATA